MTLLLLLTSMASASPLDNRWPVWRNPEEEPSCDDGPIPIMPDGGELPLSKDIKLISSFSKSFVSGGPCGVTVIVKPTPGHASVTWEAEERVKEKTLGARWSSGVTTILTAPASKVDKATNTGVPGEWVELGTWGVLEGEIAVRLTVGGVVQYPFYISSLPGTGCALSVH